MRRPIFLIFTNAMILLVIIALLAQSLVVVQRLAVARNVVGQVEVQRGGKGDFRALSAREFVKTGDVIRTNRDASAEFAWADGTRWKLMPDSLLTVKKSISNTMQRAEESQLLLNQGKVFVRVVKTLSPDSRFEVETPNAIADVRGTIFSVAVQNGQTRVQVLKGQVEVAPNRPHSSASEMTSIAPGQCVIADKTLRTEPDTQAATEFAAQTSIVQPQLQAKVAAQEDGSWIISGKTEAGNLVAIDGEKARVLGNGVFRQRVKRPDARRFVITTTDVHNGNAALALDAKPKTP